MAWYLVKYRDNFTFTVGQEAVLAQEPILTRWRKRIAASAGNRTPVVQYYRYKSFTTS